MDEAPQRIGVMHERVEVEPMELLPWRAGARGRAEIGADIEAVLESLDGLITEPQEAAR